MLDNLLTSGYKPSLNYLNAGAYAVNTIVTFGIGVSGWFDLPTNSELSAKYSTLITPDGWAFSIWSVIFLVQLAYVLMQLFGGPAYYQNHILATEGVGFYYIGVCVCQTFWTIAFANEVMWLSFIFICGILYCLVKIERTQYYLVEQEDAENANTNSNDDGGSVKTVVDITTNLREYMLLRFPFTIHCGWILVATFLNLSVCLVKYGNGGNGAGPSQKLLAAISLIVILLIAMVYMMQSEWTIPLVIAWAAFGIYAELSDPSDLILSTFKMEFIDFFKDCAILIGIVTVLGVIGHAFFWYKSDGKPTYPNCEPSDSYIAQEDENDGVMKEVA